MNAEDITIAKIEGGTLKDWLQYYKLFNIATFKNASDLKQQLLFHVINNQRHQCDVSWYTDEFQKRKEMLIVHDMKRKEALQLYVEQVEAIALKIMNLEKIAEPVRNNQVYKKKNDPLLASLLNDYPDMPTCFKKLKTLTEKVSTASLLICGDSGAGKSSFINLLIGQKILPTSIQSNTACQVKLTFGEEEKAIIVDNHNQTVEIKKEEFQTKLIQYLESYDRNSQHVRQKTCKSAVIYLNSQILKGGLDIFDTIGIGESKIFNEELKTDMPDITGVIFLLKRNNPIGDSTVGGLSEIIDHMSNGLPCGSMSFIINMCDLLPNDAKVSLKENVRAQLMSKCMKVSLEISTLSTKDELFLQSKGQMSEEYEAIIKQIQDLHLTSLCTNSIKVFDFISTFVFKTINNIKLLEKLSGLEKINRRKHIELMRDLEKNRKLLIKSFEIANDKLLKEKYNKAQQKIIQYLKTPAIKEEIVVAVIDSQRRLFNCGSIDVIHKRILDITQEKILEHLEHFNKTTNLLKEICNEMIENFLQQFAEQKINEQKFNDIIDKHIKNVLSIIQGDIIQMDLQDILQIPNQQRPMLKAISPILVPIFKTKSIISKGFSLSFGFIPRKFMEANLNRFYSNMDSYIRNQSTKNYDSYINSKKNIRMLMDLLFDAPRKATEDFKKYLYADLDELHDKISVLEDDIRKQGDVYQTYKEIKSNMNQINQDLCRFDLMYLQRDKKHIPMSEVSFTSQAIKDGEFESIPSLNFQFECQKMIPFVANETTVLYKGTINSSVIMNEEHKSKEMHGTIITFATNKSTHWDEMYYAYTQLKNISKTVETNSDSTSIGSCFIQLNYHIIYSFVDEMTNLINPTPTFFTKTLTSLRKAFDYRKKMLNEFEATYTKNIFRELQSILNQITRGLEYLHDRDLVHFDLTINSIAFDESTKSVKLTSISTPKTVTINYDLFGWKEIIKIAHYPLSIYNDSTTVNLWQSRTVNPRNSTSKSPVFYRLDEDNKYDKECDMYCLGTIIYQLWNGVHPFAGDLIEKISTVPDWLQFLKDVPKFTNYFNPDELNDPYNEQILLWTELCLDGKFNARSLNVEVNQIKDMGERNCILSSTENDMNIS